MRLIKRNENFMPSLFNSFNDNDWFRFPDTFTPNSSLPAVNIKENEDNFEVELAVPGMKKDDFKIDLDKNLLTISAEVESKNEETDEDKKYTRKEFNYSSFRRSFTLPDTVAGEKISATYNDGVLGVTLPKKEEAKPKPPVKIAIK